jgi:hypothetical protein
MDGAALLPEAVRLRASLDVTSKASTIPDLDPVVVSQWRTEIQALLRAADRLGSELTADKSQPEMCAACLLGFAKKDLRFFETLVEAFLEGLKGRTSSPSGHAGARLWEEARRLHWKLEFILTIANPCEHQRACREPYSDPRE